MLTNSRLSGQPHLGASASDGDLTEGAVTTNVARVTDAPPVDGIDAAAVTAWLAERATVVPPLRFSQITGGRSNLTYLVADAAGTRWVLRRPPLGHVLATAHDMAREHRIISAFAGTEVPVPPTVGLCEDVEVNGAPFFVMDFVEGTVLRDLDAVEAVSTDARGTLTDRLVDVLAAIHRVSPAEVGLDTLARTDGYVARQLKRWHAQWEKSAYTHVTGIDEVHARLTADIPVQHGFTIVHGDYRLDNCIVDDTGEIAAVLDWELCTLGDPLADVGLLLVYWSRPDDAFSPLPVSPTLADGFPEREHLVERYAAASGHDVTDVDYYVALGYWKLACILAGVATRYGAGAMGSTDARDLADFFGRQLDLLVGAASAAATRSGR